MLGKNFSETEATDVWLPAGFYHLQKPISIQKPASTKKHKNLEKASDFTTKTIQGTEN